jgi:hypothetical protein
VLYPALAKNGEKAHAGLAYTEQTTAKMQMAELERIDPADTAWRDKLEHIQGAVLHHMFEEEGVWFLELKEKAPDQDFLTKRYAEEYGRYVLGVADAPTPLWVHLVTVFPALIIGCLGCLRPVKAWLVASQYVHKAEQSRFGPRAD